jgi:hypothetical protein
MPANTLNNMILGFSVIIGILLIYAVSLSFRSIRAKRNADQKNQQNKT